MAEVPEHPEFSDEFLDKILDSLPEDLVDELANSSCVFDGDGIADLADFLKMGATASDVVDFLDMNDGGADLMVFSGDLIDFSGPEISRDYTPDLIDFSEPGDSRIASPFNEDAISDAEFELDEMMAMANPELVGRTERADAQLAAIAREAAHLGRLLQNSPPEEMFLDSETMPEISEAMQAMR
ncbi:hypothetical protein D9O50_02040 [Oxalobacteraceae bacterium CAVE-383]|nr:hypothetical protein D9O50_02040 [Oxalobacteraceae bacterium CAVE-383]